MDSNNPTTTLVLVRHGETDYNLNGLWQGSEIDTDLNKTGLEQANITQSHLKHKYTKFDSVYSSPLIRATQTANILTREMSVPIIFDDRLKERHCKKWCGNHVSEVKNFIDNHDEMKEMKEKLKTGEINQRDYEKRKFEVLETETNDQMATRANGFLSDIILKSSYVGKTVLVVSHGGFIKTLLKEMFPDMKYLESKNCSISVIKILENGTFQLCYQPNSDHLNAYYKSKKLIYNKFEYPKSHWIMEQKTPKVDGFVGYTFMNGHHYCIYLNQDARGYRTIVSLYDEDDIHNVLNRDYSLEERDGLLLVSSRVMAAYDQLGCVSQLQVAGNNSHSFDSSSGVIFAGSQKEPSMLHAHIICRGDPEYEYIDTVKLRGPIPGELFDMRHGKVKWENNEMNIVANILKRLLFRKLTLTDSII
jgi:broad specificity phosphatase PhoE